MTKCIVASDIIARDLSIARIEIHGGLGYKLFVGFEILEVPQGLRKFFHKDRLFYSLFGVITPGFIFKVTDNKLKHLYKYPGGRT